MTDTLSWRMIAHDSHPTWKCHRCSCNRPDTILPHQGIIYISNTVSWLTQNGRGSLKHISLFVFSIGGPKQNVKSFLTPFYESVFYALSRGSLGFALHGSFFNHFLIGWFSSTANKNLWNRQLIRLLWRTKCRLPCERAWKTVSETGVKSDLAFCSVPPIEKTNSEMNESLG